MCDRTLKSTVHRVIDRRWSKSQDLEWLQGRSSTVRQPFGESQYRIYLWNASTRLTSVSGLVLGIFPGDGFEAVGVASRLADAVPLKRVFPNVTDVEGTLEGAIV
jgi:hypothetical protein